MAFDFFKKNKGLPTLIGGFLYNLPLGSAFIWSGAGIYFTSYYRNEGFPELTILPSYIVNPLIDLVTSFGLFITNPLKKAMTPKYAMLFGGILMSLTTITASFQSNPFIFIALYVIGMGLGTALLWIIPIDNIYKFYPERKGFCSGFILSGVGLGSAIGNLLLAQIINPNNLKPIEVNNSEKYFSNEVTNSFPFALRIIGLTYLAISILGYFLTFNFEKDSSEENIQISKLT
jgi:hypothetical protein